MNCRAYWLASVSAALCLVLGCGDSGKTDGKTDKTGGKTTAGGAKHPPHGPNDGHLFELKAADGSKAMVEIFEKDEEVLAALFAADGKTALPSSAAEATVEVTVGDKPKASFKLKGEMKDGKASRYGSKDEKFHETLEAKGAKANFLVDIDGKSYSGEIAHMHH